MRQALFSLFSWLTASRSAGLQGQNSPISRPRPGLIHRLRLEVFIAAVQRPAVACLATGHHPCRAASARRGALATDGPIRNRFQ